MSKIQNTRKSYYREYIPLREVAPLDTPFSVQIDPTNCCNFRCSFCPTADDNLLESVQRPKAMLDIELFRKLMEDLRAFPRKLRQLQLYKDGEPFLNKHIYDMIAEAKRADVSERIWTTTNGSCLNPANIEHLLETGLDHLQVSIEQVHDEGYRAITDTDTRYQDIRTNVQNLYDAKLKSGSSLHVHVKIVDTGLTEDEKAVFERDFAACSDSLNITSLMGWSRSDLKDFRLGARPETGVDGFSHIQKRTVCPDPLKNLVVNADGSVTVCCVDWSHANVVGDARSESLLDIWNGERMHHFRMLQLTGRRNELPACRNCQRINGMAPASYIDDVADAILTKLASQRAQKASS